MFADLITRVHSVEAGQPHCPEQRLDLPAAEARALDLLEAWLDGAACLVDADFTLLGFGQRFAALSGQTGPLAAGDALEALMGTANWTVMRPYLDRAAQGEQVVVRIGYADGRSRRFEMRPAASAAHPLLQILIAVKDLGHATAPEATMNADVLPVPLGLLDEDGRLEWCNTALTHLIGTAAVAALDLRKPQDSLSRALAPAFAEARMGKAAGVTHPHAGQHALPRWLRFDLLADTATAGIYLYAADVDISHGASLALEQSESHFRTFTENIPEAIAFLDRKRHYQYANKAFLELVDRPREAVIGQSVEAVLGTQIAANRRPLFERALAGEVVVVEADDFLAGVRTWREIRYLPYRTREGEVQGIYVAARSIEAKRQAEGMLREEQTRIRVLTDNLPAQISYLGPDRRYRYCNNRFLADNNLTEEAVIGRTPLDVFGAETDAQLQEQLDAVVRGERVQFERRSAPSSTEPRWWRVSIVGDFDDAGVLKGTYGIAFDITEARLAQERLAEQQLWIQSFIENFPQPLCYLDTHGLYEYANRAFGVLVGRPVAEVLGMRADEVLPPQTRGPMIESFRAAMNGVPQRTEHCLGEGQTGPGWIQVDLLPDCDEHGEVRGMYALTQDITEAKRARLAYDESVREMQRAMDSVALPISYVDSKECIRFVNHTSTVWHGGHAAELIGLPLRALLSEDDYRFAKPYIEAALSGQLVQYEREMRYHDGIRRWVLLRYVPTRDEHGEVTGFYTTATDIQARKQQELALQQANWLLSAHLENTPLASFTLDADERITRWSSQAESLFGWLRDEVIEKVFWELELVDAGERDGFFPRDEMDLASEGISRRRVSYARRRDGVRVPCEWHVAALRDTRGRITSVLGLVQDVSQRVEAENRLIEIAQRDTLTKLLNRNALEPTLRAFIERARHTGSGVAVLFLDLDHFKNINDTLGHRVGDLMLIEIAQTLRHCIQDEGEVARIGGDEFMVILGHQRPKAVAHETAQRIIQSLRDPIRVENQRLSVAASIGVAVYPDHGRSPDALLRSADLAMYKAKENGKNRFEFFSAALAQRSERRAGIKTALKLALQRDALKLYYQPRVRVLDGRMVGAEALLRWTDSRLGVIGPKEFIGIAEESGLIHELGLFVFRKACRQLRDWQERGVEVGTVSVNFSAHQLLVATFIDEVDLVIEETGCDPRDIEVEITETSMLFDLGITKNVIADLKHRGMQIAIDDFGTGFSSLSHLQQLDIDSLKIDQSFIRDMLDDGGDLAITRSVISLGRGLGLSVTAEGVENERQLNALREAGCDHFQGFLFSPAVDVDDLELLAYDNAAKASAT